MSDSVDTAKQSLVSQIAGNILAVDFKAIPRRSASRKLRGIFVAIGALLRTVETLASLERGCQTGRAGIHIGEQGFFRLPRAKAQRAQRL